MKCGLKRGKFLWKYLLLVVIIYLLIEMATMKCWKALIFNEKMRQNPQNGTNLQPTKDTMINHSNLNKQVIAKDSLCKKGYFKVDGMDECHKWLGCKELVNLLNNRDPRRKYGAGASKQVYPVMWETYQFALSRTRNTQRKDAVERSRMGIENIIKLQPSKHVIQLIGHCESGNNTMYLTESCDKYGTLEGFVKSENFLDLTVKQRLGLVIDIIEGYVFLHYGSGEPKVHCDVHDPMQALGQFLVTNDMKVVLNDIDELPVDNPKKNKIAKCPAEMLCKMTNPQFLPPEEHYTEKDCRAVPRSKRLHEVSIKTDIWKIPGISQAIMNGSLPNDRHATEVKTINKMLTSTHKHCKQNSPSRRINSKKLLEEYMNVYKTLKD